MAKISRLLAATALALVGCATSHDKYLYFPGLANRALSGDASALREVLAKAQETPPGEQLEELAEISSKFVLINPTEFLRAQSLYQGCFGVDFLGPAYADSFDAAIAENTRRNKALESVADTTLADVKWRCISDLDLGSGS